MRTLMRAVTILLAAALLAGCAGRQPTKPSEFVIPAGESLERCFTAGPHSPVWYWFNASGPVSLRFLDGNKKSIVIQKSENVATDHGEFRPNTWGIYCAVFTNQGKEPVTVSYRYDTFTVYTGERK